MATEYISREAAEKILYDGCHTTDGEEMLDDVVEMWHMVQAIPTANVRPVVMAKWEDETGYIFNPLAQ